MVPQGIPEKKFFLGVRCLGSAKTGAIVQYITNYS
jgi:hypothetical protein